jgi:hypothetical protein
MSKRSEAIKAAYEKGYRVVEDGRVISPRGRHLSLFSPKTGRQYLRFTIYFNGGPICLDVHRLAGYQKFGNKIFESGQQVRHLNDIGIDNRLDNIGLGNASENALDMSEEKRRKRSAIGGYKGGRANRVFTREQIHSILYRLDQGEPMKAIANNLGVVRETISNIKLGKSYQEWYCEYRKIDQGS